MKIRPACADDADRLTAIARAAKRHWRYPDEWLRLWADELTVTADDIQDHRVFCAEDDGVIVGFYAVSGDGSVAELEHMWVEPDAIGRGFGSELFTHAIATAAGAGAECMRMASDPHAEGFYLHQGARRIGTVPSTPEGRHLPLLEIAIDPVPASRPMASHQP